MKPTETQVGGGCHKCECRLCERTRQFHEIISVLEPSKRAWMMDFYNSVYDTEAELEMMQAHYECTPVPDSTPKKKAIWHNPDGLESAGEGYRFLIQGVETRQDATEYFMSEEKGWLQVEQDEEKTIYSNVTYRTNKPLPEGWEE